MQRCENYFRRSEWILKHRIKKYAFPYRLIVELAELVIWHCFDKVEPATKETLNCYLFLMNEYSLKTFGKSLTSDIFFCHDKNYPYIPRITDKYPYPGEILPTGERPRTEISGELKWFLDGLIDYNKKNPFKILADCKNYKNP